MGNEADQRTEKLASIGKAVASDKCIDHADVFKWERDIDSTHSMHTITSFAKDCQDFIKNKRPHGFLKFLYKKTHKGGYETVCFVPFGRVCPGGRGQGLRVMAVNPQDHGARGIFSSWLDILLYLCLHLMRMARAIQARFGIPHTTDY